MSKEVRDILISINEIITGAKDDNIYGIQVGEYRKIRDCIINLEKENEQLKKQKDDVVEYIKTHDLFDRNYDDKKAKNDLLRMLGEIDVED